MIINPLWFYLIGIAEGVQDLFFMCGFFSLVGGIVCYIAAMIEDKIKYIKPAKTIAILGLIALLLSTLIPNEKACYSMAVASCITTENIEYASELGKNVVDYVTEKVVELIEAGE